MSRGRDVERAICPRLRTARRHANLTQAEVGTRLCPVVSHAAVSDIERGATRLTVALVYDLADLYGVPAGDLLPGVGPPPRIEAARSDDV